MTPEHETFEEWLERTKPRSTASRFTMFGTVLAGLLWLANVLGLGPLWLVLVPALVMWTITDHVRTRRRIVGRVDQ